MKHFIASTTAAITLAATFCCFAQAATQRSESPRQLQTVGASVLEVDSQRANLLSDDDQDPTSMTGKFYLWGLGGGYVYFSVNVCPFACSRLNFPNPIPWNGTIVTVALFVVPSVLSASRPFRRSGTRLWCLRSRRGPALCACTCGANNPTDSP
jgi:hypothetical protein